MDSTTRHRIAAGAAALALLTGGGLVAGCGSSGDASGDGASTAATSTAAANGIETKSAQEILDAAKTAALAATSVTVKGAISQGGENIALDLQVGQEASQGSITAKGVTIQMKMLAGKIYFKVSGDDFATLLGQDDSPEVADAISSLLGDKWLVAPEGASANGLEAFGELGQKDSLLNSVLTASGTVAVDGTGDVNGQPVVLLTSSGSAGTLAIATTGEPYPVQVKSSDGSDGGQIDFTDWNAPIEVTAPTDVLDIGALAQLGGASGG